MNKYRQQEKNVNEGSTQEIEVPFSFPIRQKGEILHWQSGPTISETLINNVQKSFGYSEGKLPEGSVVKYGSRKFMEDMVKGQVWISEAGSFRLARRFPHAHAALEKERLIRSYFVRC